MTDDRLRTELEALERAAPIGQMPEIESAHARPWRRIGLIGATVVAAVALTSLAFGHGRSFDVGSRSTSPIPSGPTASENPPAIAETRVGDFILTISSPKTFWAADEAIDVSASLMYDGSDSAVQIGAGVHPMVFIVKDLRSGETVLNGAQFAICLSHELIRGEPLRQAFVKAGEVAPIGEFDEEFFGDPALRIPPGEWEFTALTSFDERGCGDDYELEVSIVLQVIAPSSPSPMPSPDVTTAPSEPGPSPTSQIRACAAALAYGVLDGDADGNPILIMEEGLPPVSILFSYPEDFVIESTPALTIYDRDGNVLAREGDEVELGGGFNADDTIFHACGIHRPNALATADCALPPADCELALSAAAELLKGDADPEEIIVGWGRGLVVWHAQVHVCWVDGRHALIDVIGPGGTDDLTIDDVTASVRENPPENSPCS